MVKLIPPPQGVQDRLVYDYLYQLQEYLGLVIGQGGDGSVQSTSGARGRAQTGTEDGEIDEQRLLTQYRALKALIIKTADRVESRTQIDLSGLRDALNSLDGIITGEDGLQATLLAIQRDYVAQGVFGTYQEQINQRLVVDEAGLEQQIQTSEAVRADVDAVTADFNAYRIATKGYIRSGIIGRRADETPIIGIAIGQDIQVEINQDGTEKTEQVEIDGELVPMCIISQAGYRAMYAADELSFWQDGVKVAWVNGNQFHISDGQGGDLIDAMNDRITLAVSTVQDLEERADSGAFKGDPGESPYMLQVVSDNGGVFKNGNVSTVLRAKVWHGTEEVTTHFNANDFHWTRVSADAEGDVLWNNEHFSGSKTVTITTADVQVRATFFCELKEGAEDHEPVRITTQPVDFVGELGDTASFTVEAEGYGLTYQWQVWNERWANSGSGGNKTARLHSITITEARLGYRYRCNVTDANGNTVTSDEVRMRLPQQEE